MKKKMDLLHPYGKLDTLKYYSLVSEKLKKFLKNKEIATIIHIPPGIKLLRRATKLGRLYAKDIKATKEFLEFRATHKLKQAKGKFSYPKLKIWRYFFPRKFVELHYAVNSENIHSEIDRVYIDIDRSNLDEEKAKQVVLSLINVIKKDKAFNSHVKDKFFILWTGNSFHLYLLLKKPINHKEFMNIFSLNGLFLKKWASQVQKQTKIPVKAEHEKKKNLITLDTSQSPPGKLARAPFCLYISKGLRKKISGIAIPVTQAQLKQKNIIQKLKTLTPEKVINNIGSYKKLL